MSTPTPPWFPSHGRQDDYADQHRYPNYPFYSWYTMLAEKDAVLESVFSNGQNAHTTPTPIATPDLGSTAAGQSFGGLASPISQKSQPSGAAQQQVKLNYAWSTATRFLTELLENWVMLFETLEELPFSEPTPEHVREAIDLLIVNGISDRLSQVDYPLIPWFTHEVQCILAGTVGLKMQGLTSDWNSTIPGDESYEKLRAVVSSLTKSYRFHRQTLIDHLVPSLERAEHYYAANWVVQNGPEEDRPRVGQLKAKVLAKFERDLHQYFIRTCLFTPFYDALSFVVYETALTVFRIRMPSNAGDTNFAEGKRLYEVGTSLFQLLSEIHSVGLGGDNTQIALSTAANKAIDAFLSSSWAKVRWYGDPSSRDSPVVNMLRTWVTDGLVPFMNQAMRNVNPDGDFGFFTQEHASNLLDIAMAKLAQARTQDLFDFVVQWPESLSAIRDLKESTTSVRARTSLIQIFSEQLHRRLLHAGATTTDILNVYLYTIRTFAEIDPKGALINRASLPIQLYLRNRHDTADVIVSSMLTDPEAIEPNAVVAKGSASNHIQVIKNTSIEIAKEMQKPLANTDQRDLDLNWDDMDWAPDPIDAGPDYQRTKVEDIFGHLFKLFDRDSFIDVLKTILCKHLLSLKDTPDFAKEIKVLELFKLRLGEDNLQACEVMLNDVVSSGRTNQSVHRSEAYKANSDPDKDTPEVNCTIFSSFFWPPLKDLHVKLPQAMKDIQDRYQSGYQSNKGSQGPGTQAGTVSALLEFNNALGTVEIELEVEGQAFCENVSPLLAAVIYAFDEDLGGGRKSCAAIANELEVGQADVMNALNFWMSKGIIRPAPPRPDGVILFEVWILDPLPGASITDNPTQVIEAMSLDQAAESAARTAATQEQNAMLTSPNAQLYSNYIKTMLTSNGNMPVARIAQLLKMTMTGGFSYSNDVLIEFLDSMVKEGLLRTKNGVYGVPKKKT